MSRPKIEYNRAVAQVSSGRYAHRGSALAMVRQSFGNSESKAHKALRKLIDHHYPVKPKREWRPKATPHPDQAAFDFSKAPESKPTEASRPTRELSLNPEPLSDGTQTLTLSLSKVNGTSYIEAKARGRDMLDLVQQVVKSFTYEPEVRTRLATPMEQAIATLEEPYVLLDGFVPEGSILCHGILKRWLRGYPTASDTASFSANAASIFLSHRGSKPPKVAVQGKTVFSKHNVHVEPLCMYQKVADVGILLSALQKSQRTPRRRGLPGFYFQDAVLTPAFYKDWQEYKALVTSGVEEVPVDLGGSFVIELLSEDRKAQDEHEQKQEASN